MNVDGIGDRPVVDSGGFPVVWIGDPNCTIGQDPGQGGTNCYGPGDVLVDAETGAQYQIGGDWHLRTIGSDSGSSGGGGAPSQPDPTVVNHFFYVDGGEIIEKTEWSDGSATYGDTGMSSPLADGTAANDAGSLTQTQQSSSSSSGGDNGTQGGFGAPNAVGGYGPYATPDPPQLTDQGTYVDHGRVIDHQVDQYGNDYYTDIGPAPSSSTPSAPPPRSSPAPTVPTIRSNPPGIYTGPTVTAPPGTTHVPGTTTPTVTLEPHARDGQSLSGQSQATQTLYRTLYGPNAAQVWANQHDAATGAAGPQSPSTTTRPPSTVSGVSSTGPSGTGTVRGPGGSSPPAISPTGNASQWAKQAIDWLGRSNFIGGVPNGALVAGGYVALRMLRRRR